LAARLKFQEVGLMTTRRKKTKKGDASSAVRSMIGQLVPRKVQDRINEDVLPKGPKRKK
jgi:hypothetical protein